MRRRIGNSFDSVNGMPRIDEMMSYNEVVAAGEPRAWAVAALALLSHHYTGKASSLEGGKCDQAQLTLILNSEQ